jgi:AcrR family transcriptional regulator
MGRPSAAAARDTRQLLLDAALDLFADRGFHATSMRALAAAVGVRESAIYHHFPSKEALLAAVAEPHARARIEIAEREIKLAGKRALVDTLTAIGTRLIEHMQRPEERKALRLATAISAQQLGPDLSPLLRVRDAVRGAFHRLLDELQRLGKVRRDLDRDAFMISFGLPLVFASGALWGGKLPIPIPTARFVRAHASLMARAIGAEK